MKNLLLIIFLSLVAFSCKKDNYLVYDSADRIQFGPDIAYIYQSNAMLFDTLKSQTFYYYADEVKTDTVFFDIYAIGGPKDFDRSFKLQQVLLNGMDNAVPGQHYVAFDDANMQDDYLFKAGEVHKKIPIVLLRDPSMKTKSFVLKFNVVANENFQLGETSNSWRKVIMTDRLSKPDNWTSSVNNVYLGEYSVRKHRFIIEVSGQKWDFDFIKLMIAEPTLLDYYKSVFKIALIEYNKNNPIMLDENGVEVKFP